jgi:dephospho-CoA kinase
MVMGITGTIGAGKGTVVEYLVREKNFVHHSVSEFLAQVATSRGIEPDRIARRNVANEFRTKGATALMEAVYASAEADIVSGKNVIIDPQHTKGEVEFVKDKGGLVFAIDADLKTRYERISKRGSAKDNVSYEQFVEEQTHEMASVDPNKNNLASAIESADFYILNNGTVEELEKEVERVLGNIHNTHANIHE